VDIEANMPKEGWLPGAENYSYSVVAPPIEPRENVPPLVPKRGRWGWTFKES
jgi:hypothetical protein